MNRRRCLKSLATTGVLAGYSQWLQAAESERFSVEYVLATALYGDMSLNEVLPEVEYTNSIGLDLWGKPHGSQREEVDEMGIEAFAQLLEEQDVDLVVSTRYPLGCFGLQPEMPILRDLGGRILVSGASGPTNPTGEDAKKGIKEFLEKMKPHADAAGEHGLTIAVENHSNQVMGHPDGIRYFAEFNQHEALGIAFAPHHLRDHINLIPELILTLGDENLPFIYFQEYGDGAHFKLQKNIELEQLPGRGVLDYSMVVRALKLIKFSGVAEIFMHTTPRGVPVLDSAEDITELINESRIYVDQCIMDLQD